jgi:uncharacterized membrane protein YcaP (DUF421 family)
MEILWTIFLRTVFMYLFILVMMRIMGKREVGKLSLFDLIVSFMMADISAIVLERGGKEPLINGIVPIATLAGLQILLSFMMFKSKKIRNFVGGRPSVIVKNGKIRDAAMKKERYNTDDLLVQLRENKIANIADVEVAVLEPSGKLNVFEKTTKKASSKHDPDSYHALKPFQMPIPVIVEGKVQDKVLTQLGRTRFWLKNQIQKGGYKDFKEIFYASIDQSGKLYMDSKDQKNNS